MILNQTKDSGLSATSILLIYSETFQPNHVVGNEMFTKDDLAYLSQPLVMLTSFLGLPNNRRRHETVSLNDLFKNMIGWKTGQPRDWLLALPIFLFYFMRSLIKTTFNVVKIFTEFLPGLAEEGCRKIYEDVEQSAFIRNMAYIGYSIFDTLHFFGRAMTSPVKGYLNKHQNSEFSGLSLFISSMGWSLIAGGIALAVAAVGSFVFVPVMLVALVVVFTGVVIASSKSVNPPTPEQKTSSNTTTILLTNMPTSPSISPAQTEKKTKVIDPDKFCMEFDPKKDYTAEETVAYRQHLSKRR